MSDIGQHEPDEYAPLRRLLKELPKLDAAPDFEIRLQRNLQKEKHSPAARRRLAIPVFAYSLLTLLVVTVVSYYTFFRASETPTLPKPSPAAGRPEPARTPSSTGPTQDAESPSKEKNAVPEEARTPERDAVSKPDVQANGNRRAEPRQLAVPERVPSEEPMKEVQSEGNAETPPVQELQEVAAPAVGVPQHELMEQNREVPKTPPVQAPVPGIVPFNAPALKSSAGAVNRLSVSAAPAVLDSTARRDSLPPDSQKSKDQRPAKVKKGKGTRPLE